MCKENNYTISMTFGKWLGSKREAAELTQDQLAKRVGVSVSYISALERDEPNAKDGSPRRPRIEKVDAIAKALKVAVDDARLAAGYAPDSHSFTLDISPDLRVSLLNRNVSAKDRATYELALRTAYETAKVIIETEHDEAPPKGTGKI